MRTNQLLIIDDHPMVVRGYCYTLASIQDNLKLNIHEANSCTDVLRKLENSKTDFYHVVLLDISLPASECGIAASGEDLGLRIRVKFPTTKIIVQTGLNDIDVITNVFHSLKP